MQSSNRVLKGLPALIALMTWICLGAPFIKVLSHERPWSTLMLLAIVFACSWRLLQTLQARHVGGSDRLLATRELTSVVASLVACIAVATGISWARGSAVVATAFVLLIEYLQCTRT